MHDISEVGSAEKDFEMHGCASVGFSGRFFLRFSRRILVIDYAERWTSFLQLHDTRRYFLTACFRLCDLAKSSEIMIVPEGSIVADLAYGKANFQDVKQQAELVWGKPDLDIEHIYSEEEVALLGTNRVHYFLVTPAHSSPDLS